ncbi:MAG: DNA adenine methylase [Mariprofundales bacterium]
MMKQHSLFKGCYKDTTENPRFLSEQIITYIGNKRALLNFIGIGLEKVQCRLGKTRGKQNMRIFDVFSGSGIVARYLKKYSNSLYVCDLEHYSQALNNCYLASQPGCALQAAIKEAISFINYQAVHSPEAGFIADLYSPIDDTKPQYGERVFYTRRNAEFLDTARKIIDDIDIKLQPFVLAPLIYKASVHANTSGVFKGFYKNSTTGIGQFGGNGKDALTRILGEIYIPKPVFSNYNCDVKIFCDDANNVTTNNE